MDTDTDAAARRDTGVFRREGEYWLIIYEEVTCRLRDSVGLRQLAELLSRPGERISALELRGVGQRDVGRPNGLPFGGATAEQARVNTTRAVRSALRRIATHHHRLGDHLHRTVRTGAACIYAPDPRVPLQWRVGFGEDREVDE